MRAPMLAVFLAPLIAGAAAPPYAPPKRVDPRPVTPLPSAEIDNSLAITGDDIAAQKVRSRMTVAVRVNGKGPYRFVVDSGADISVVGLNLASSLALPPGKSVVLNGMTESAVVQRVQVDSLALGRNELSPRQLPVLREADLGGDGMIGIDSLAQQRLMLDFENRSITVEEATQRETRMEGEVVVTARRRRGQLILTQVRANGRPLSAVIDTGSEITIGNPALRDLLVRGREERYLQPVEVTGVTGRKMTLQLATIAELRIGSIIFRNIPIAFADVPPFRVFDLSKEPSMLLGTDLMEQFRRISLDFRSRKVRFQLRRCRDAGIAVSFGTSSRLGAAPGAHEVCAR